MDPDKREAAQDAGGRLHIIGGTVLGILAYLSARLRLRFRSRSERADEPEAAIARVVEFATGASQIVGGIMLGCLPYMLAWLWLGYGPDGPPPANKGELIVGFFSTVLVTVAFCIVLQGVATHILLRRQLKLAALGIWLVYAPVLLLFMI